MPDLLESGSQCAVKLLTNSVQTPAVVLSLYPNPVVEEFALFLGAGSSYDYLVYDQSGYPVLEGSAVDGEKIDASALMMGAYTISITANGEMYRSAFFVNK